MCELILVPEFINRSHWPRFALIIRKQSLIFNQNFERSEVREEEAMQVEVEEEGMFREYLHHGVTVL